MKDLSNVNILMLFSWFLIGKISILDQIISLSTQVVLQATYHRTNQIRFMMKNYRKLLKDSKTVYSRMIEMCLVCLKPGPPWFMPICKSIFTCYIQPFSIVWIKYVTFLAWVNYFNILSMLWPLSIKTILLWSYSANTIKLWLIFRLKSTWIADKFWFDV